MWFGQVPAVTKIFTGDSPGGDKLGRTCLLPSCDIPAPLSLTQCHCHFGRRRAATLAKQLESFRPSDGTDEEGAEEEAPSELNTRNYGGFLEVGKDKLSVRYTGHGQHGHDVGSIQANRPVPRERLLYYFELTVRDRGDRNCIAIGFTDENFKHSRQPGWEAGSYGYHGDDGKAYHASGRGDAYGPTFTTGDVVGAGVNHATQEIFFTKNGKHLGVAFADVREILYPTVGLHSKNERVEVNFGKRPFKFDLEALVQEERERRQRAVELVEMPSSISHSIVRGYLLHYGYQDTLNAFDGSEGVHSAPGSSQNGNGHLAHKDIGWFALDERKQLRQLIGEGKIDGALQALSMWYPSILQDSRTNVAFLLNCQKFVEYIKLSQLDEAVKHARGVLSTFRGYSALQDAHLEDVLALLAYEDPSSSPVAYLLSHSQREVVADTLSASVLALASPTSRPPQSALELLLRQLTACHTERRLVDGGQGEVFRLTRLLNGG
ncbi:spla ryanodine receptor domain-containing protein [Klebsormidium nitens]|uniref:Spla ryanodine receptor domain-containing protein n=1 Tax=Klebsormidium nitens TaxID=105231 RepID=A0A1Y1I3W8_KLENI|nr:spla ryanodine receptor domain-containing protein [Klebsormidium nitens]|eukprot:GAQ84119.1 spla ryanodine receptor domain-containing protein [Klebsormidium nitens]